jgi:hypothetical protein
MEWGEFAHVNVQTGGQNLLFARRCATSDLDDAKTDAASPYPLQWMILTSTAMIIT